MIGSEDKRLRPQVNTGSTSLSSLTLTDNLGTYGIGTAGTTVTPLTYVENSVRYFVNGVLQTNPTVTVGGDGTMTITGLNVPAGGNVILAYSATANEYAPLGADAQINNVVSVTGTGLAEAVVASDSIAVDDAAALTVTKSVSPLTVVGEGPLTYTFVIQNRGTTAVTTADNTVLTDTFNPALNITEVTFNGADWAETTNYTYDQGSGLFTTVANQITVPAASYTQDATTGVWSITPGTSTLTVTGTIA